MSLIVARKSGTHISIVGDSVHSLTDVGRHLYASTPERITSKDRLILKSVVLGKNLCLSWAGESYFANSAFSRIWQGPLAPTFEEVLATAVNASKQSNGETDFLLASLRPNCLVTIRGGVVESHDSYCCIGSPYAEREYLRLEAPQPPSSTNAHTKIRITRVGEPGAPTSSQIGQMTRAMAQLVEDDSLPEVGMFVVPVDTATEEFHYALYAEIDAPPHPSARPDGTWHTVPLGSVETGSYAYQCVELDHGGIRIPIIHLLQAGIAYAFEDRSSGAPRAMLLAKDSPLVRALSGAT